MFKHTRTSTPKILKIRTGKELLIPKASPLRPNSASSSPVTQAGLDTLNFISAGTSSYAQSALLAGMATTQQVNMARAVNAAVTIPNLANQIPNAIRACQNDPLSSACLIQAGSTTLTAIGGISDAVYSGRQIKPWIASEIEESSKLYAFNPRLKPKSNTPSGLYQRELTEVKKVTDTYLDYGRQLREGYVDARMGRPEGLYDIAREAGYEIEEIRFGDQFLNTRNQMEKITPGNAVRLGQGNKLYVGSASGSFEPSAAMDLCHDVATCLLGGKVIRDNGVAEIRPSTIQDITEVSIERMTLEEMRAAGLLTNQNMVPSTWLLDALIHQKIKYRSVKYLPFGR